MKISTTMEQSLRISSPDSSSPRAQAADWFELSTLAAGRTGYSLASLLGALNIQEQPSDLIEDEGGVVEDEILEIKYEAFSDDLLTEIQWRSAVLQDLYPFEIQRSTTTWKLIRRRATDGSTRSAHMVYLVCLVIAATRYGFLTDPDAEKLWSTSPRVFQIVAHLTSRGLFRGSSFWMGSPRPERDGYAPALKRLVGKLEVGVTKEKPPVSQQGWVKDGGIDVIAWRPFRDRRPTPVLSYGQVASGQDWETKSVEATLDSHFHNWMIDRPSKWFLPAMYIPFMQHESVAPRVGADFDEVAHSKSVALELRLGLVIDRLRLTELSPDALARATEEDQALAAEVIRWLALATRKLRGTDHELVVGA